ncbi:hypothetical protein CAURIC_06965 [Corynebacterium auriscanis]|nr:hypothetical protein CAURIC_06965 [Corynebacterium auriscanis]
MLTQIPRLKTARPAKRKTARNHRVRRGTLCTLTLSGTLQNNGCRFAQMITGTLYSCDERCSLLPFC